MEFLSFRPAGLYLLNHTIISGDIQETAHFRQKDRDPETEASKSLSNPFWRKVRHCAMLRSMEVRYFRGDIPYCLEKTVEKYAGESKPQVCPISWMGRLVETSS